MSVECDTTPFMSDTVSPQYEERNSFEPQLEKRDSNDSVSSSDTINSNYKPPGRLGDHNMKFFQEPRAHPKLVETFRAFGVDGSQPNPFKHMKWDDLCSNNQMAQNHVDTATIYEMLPNDLPEDELEPKILQRTVKYKTFDGTERKLHVFEPEDSDGLLPCVMYTASAVTILETANKVHFRWCTSLALQGMVVIAVDFRSAWNNGRHCPFPTGLNDCVSAFEHINARKDDFGISKIILQGESGGANLALATALRAKKEGWSDQIAGVYGISPWISNAYGWSDARKLEELPSLFECEGYWLYTAMLAGMGEYYSGEDNQNPLAWPYHASVEECKGLPPHTLVMDELDPLKDEGMAYYRKLLAAGVQVNAHVNLGIVHGSALMFRRLLPEVHKKAILDIAVFVQSL
ncbi:alpha/beta hydrolase like protein [Zymoseptoria brevis]|uniref:Alpha/beta hydrolase like protein n=1 Tax=Zymoseptoria brevis TaxID=1047168 RepID=A0A0F4G599_9PEZI|nr:alpha/beta hydrolase like protein [Zymoseptoria brevis]